MNLENMTKQEPDTGYWFPAKRYGWGWGPPVDWRGWVFMFGWLAVFFSGVGFLISRSSLMHVPFAAAMVIVLLAVCYWKGERPRWRWGK
jgi:hypothetical protein